MNQCQTHNLGVHIAAVAQPGSPNSKLLDGSITSIYNTEAVTLRGSACRGCSQMTSAEFTELTSLTAGNEFNGCTALTSFSAPKLVSITGSNTFSGCTALQTVSFPKLTDWTSTSGSFTELTLGTSDVLNFNLGNIASRVIANNSTSCLNCKGSTSITYYSGKSVVLLKYIDSGGGCFGYCSNLKEVHFDSVTTVERSVFRDCVSLETVVLGSPGHPVQSISSTEVFSGVPATAFITIYTSNGQALSGAPFAWSGGTSNINWQQA